MSRASWLFVGMAVAVAACAAGAVEDDSSLGGDGGPAAAVSNGEGGSGPDGSPARAPADGSGPATTDDTGAPQTSDDSSTPGDDAAGDDGSAGEGGHDASSADAGHDAGHDSGTPTPDSGHDSGSPTPDAGEDAGCTPTTPAFTKVFHPGALAGFCDATQIGDFYSACFAGTSALCASWQGASANASCNTCLTGASDPAGSSWGPIVNYPVSGISELDLGGCIDYDPLAGGGSTVVSTCAKDLEYLIECEHAACDAPCGTSSSTNSYDACATAADKDATLCLSEYNAVNGAGLDCSKVSSACFGGSDFQSSFTAVATVMCD